MPIFVNSCLYYKVITREKEQTIELFYKLLKSFVFVLKSFNHSANRRTYMGKHPSSIIVVHAIR